MSGRDGARGRGGGVGFVVGGGVSQVPCVSAPERLIEVLDDPYRPQPRLDRDAGGGMTTVVGRVREENVLGGAWGVKYVLVSHNTRMGAAKGMTLVAETLLQEGWIG